MIGSQGLAGHLVSIGGGSSSPVAISIVEIDFGVYAVCKNFTIVDATVSPESNIMATQSGKAATGRYADENEMDPILFSAVPGSGQFTLYANPLAGAVGGKFNVCYLVG